MEKLLSPRALKQTGSSGAVVVWTCVFTPGNGTRPLLSEVIKDYGADKRPVLQTINFTLNMEMDFCICPLLLSGFHRDIEKLMVQISGKNCQFALLTYKLSHEKK